MNKLNDWIKSKLKNWLLFFVRRLDEKYQNTPSIRLSSGSSFNRKLKIPLPIIIAVTYLVLYFMLLMQIGIGLSNGIAVFIILSILFFFILLYVNNQTKISKIDNDIAVLVSFIFIISLLIFQIFDKSLSPIAFPMSAFSIILCILVSLRISFIYIFVMTIFISVINNFNNVVPMIHLVGCLTSIIGIREIRNRSQFINVGIKIALSMALFVIVLYLLKIYPLVEVKYNIWFSLLSGFLSVLIVLVALPILETLFSRTTNIKLIELVDFNNVLLKKLMVEAPGTYHHSLLTASLAEQAATAISDNSLLARACAYYHDIGKLKNPEYFIENQNTKKNPHDELAPSLSGLILISHVKDGIALAKKYNIDDVIIKAINEHHGTSVIQYFYNKSLEQNKELNEQDFRYPCQKPTTKVTAILMIADSVEAISRILPDKNAGKLKEVVEKVINNKFTDGQFSECPITLADLVKIAESMTTTLCGIYHARIEYKDVEKK
ncbi:MAG: HDIG domain-containing protein [Endomicrobiaceae bacterium]|nr:HDIG domain-containing protein [Endomicrobiaceae bacterium]